MNLSERTLVSFKKDVEQYIITMLSNMLQGNDITQGYLVHPADVARELTTFKPTSGSEITFQANIEIFDYLLENYLCYLIPTHSALVGDLRAVYTYDINHLAADVMSEPVKPTQGKQLESNRAKLEMGFCCPFKVSVDTGKGSNPRGMVDYKEFVPYPVEWYNAFGIALEAVLFANSKYGNAKYHARPMFLLYNVKNSASRLTNGVLSVNYDSAVVGIDDENVSTDTGVELGVGVTKDILTTCDNNITDVIFPTSMATLLQLATKQLGFNSRTGAGTLNLLNLGVSLTDPKLYRAIPLYAINSIKFVTDDYAMVDINYNFMTVDWTTVVPALVEYVLHMGGVKGSKDYDKMEAVYRCVTGEIGFDRNTTAEQDKDLLLGKLWEVGLSPSAVLKLYTSIQASQDLPFLHRILASVSQTAILSSAIYKPVLDDVERYDATFNDRFKDLLKHGVIKCEYTTSKGKTSTYTLTNNEVVLNKFYGDSWREILGLAGDHEDSLVKDLEIVKTTLDEDELTRLLEKYALRGHFNSDGNLDKDKRSYLRREFLSKLSSLEDNKTRRETQVPEMNIGCFTLNPSIRCLIGMYNHVAVENPKTNKNIYRSFKGLNVGSVLYASEAEFCDTALNFVN